MAIKRHTPEEIVAKLRQVDVLTSQGSTVADAVRKIGVTEVIIIESWRRHDNTGAAARLSGLPPTGPGGLHSGVCRVAGGATWIGFAGHAPAGAKTSSQSGSAPPAGSRRSRRPTARPYVTSVTPIWRTASATVDPCEVSTST